jgi:hypothetical protein
MSISNDESKTMDSFQLFLGSLMARQTNINKKVRILQGAHLNSLLNALRDILENATETLKTPQQFIKGKQQKELWKKNIVFIETSNIKDVQRCQDYLQTVEAIPPSVVIIWKGSKPADSKGYITFNVDSPWPKGVTNEQFFDFCKQGLKLAKSENS